MRQFDRANISCRIPGNVWRDAIEFIKPVRGWQALRSASQMPLSKDCRGIAGALEQLAHREGACRKRIGTALNGNEREAAADRVLSGHQRGARWRAGRLNQELSEPHSLAGQLVETRRWCATQLSATI